jgi:hypothetical protein
MVQVELEVVETRVVAVVLPSEETVLPSTMYLQALILSFFM